MAKAKKKKPTRAGKPKVNGKAPVSGKPMRPLPKKKAKAKKKAPARALVSVADVEVVDVELEKSDDSPDLVRVTSPAMPGDVIPPLNKKGKIPGRAVGSFVRIRIEVTGNPGDTATLSIGGATPTSVSVTIPNDAGQTAASQSLQVTG